MVSPEIHISDEYISGREQMRFEEVANLFAALDSEPKCILLVSMSDNHIYARNELNRLMVNAQSAEPGWRLSERTGIFYCAQSFEPIGLVASEVTDKNRGVIGYMKTKKGSDVGTSIAGYLLDFSSKSNHTIYDFLGSTPSTSPVVEIQLSSENTEKIEFRKRSPALRIKLYEALAQDGFPTSATDLAQFVGEDRSIVGRHLRDLAGKGILGYDSLNQQRSEADATEWEYKDTTKSKISLDEKQKAIIVEFVELINKIRMQDLQTITLGKVLARQILDDRNFVSGLMARAKEASPQGNKSPELLTIRQISSLLEEFEGMTAVEVRDELEKRGNKLSLDRVRSILRKMKSNDIINAKNQGELRTRWQLN